jgi:hypothetical protein
LKDLLSRGTGNLTGDLSRLPSLNKFDMYTVGPIRKKNLYERKKKGLRKINRVILEIRGLQGGES